MSTESATHSCNGNIKRGRIIQIKVWLAKQWTKKMPAQHFLFSPQSLSHILKKKQLEFLEVPFKYGTGAEYLKKYKKVWIIEFKLYKRDQLWDVL